MKRTHKPISLLKIPGRATTHAPRVYLDVDIGLSENVPDLVNSRLQFSVLEDGRGFVGRVRVHGARTSTTTWGTRVGHDASLIQALVTVTRHTFARRVSRVSVVPPA